MLIDYTVRKTEPELDLHTTWVALYEIWLKWQNIKENVKFCKYVSPAQISRITCVSCVGKST